MKALDYFRASKTKRSLGDRHQLELSKWHKHHEKMVQEMKNGTFKPVTLGVDYMEPENLIFYDISGSKMADANTMFTINTTTIDTGEDFTQHIRPTYFLVRDPKSKGPISTSNTRMYRVTYQKQKDSQDYSYTIDTLIDNQDETTSKFFPELFCSMKVSQSPISYKTTPEYDYSYYPLAKYRDSQAFAHRKGLSRIENIYETRILSKIKAFGHRPHSNFDAEKEL